MTPIETLNGEVIDLKECYEQKDFVDLQVELLPEEYKKLIWQQPSHPETKHP